VKSVAPTLGVARPNVIERRDGADLGAARRSAPAAALAGQIRELVDKRSIYGYRRIAALLGRGRRSAGEMIAT
jgi:putative transposase